MLNEFNTVTRRISTFIAYCSVHGDELNLLEEGENILSAYQDDLTDVVKKAKYILESQIKEQEMKFNMEFTSPRYTASFSDANDDNVQGAYLKLRVSGTWK